MNNPIEPEQQITKKKKLSTGAKWGIGCGCGCLTLLIIAVLLGTAGVVFIKKIITKYEAELRGFGFTNVVTSQMIELTEPVTERKLYKAQMIHIKTDSTTDMAVLAQICELYGTVNGTFYFRGQMLTIKPGAKILGNANIEAQVLQNEGHIAGTLTGKYQLIGPSAPANSNNEEEPEPQPNDK